MKKIRELQSLLSKVLVGESIDEINRLAKMYLEDVGDEYEGRIDDDVKKFKNGLPIQYITNTQYFYGYRFYVDSAVLIPRPETEELVYWIESDYKESKKNIQCLDIGTGSGIIPISLAKKFTNWELTGMDLSSSALEVAIKNGADLGVAVSWIQQDILNSDQWKGHYDVIVSNPPYISLEEKSLMSESTIKYEPDIALFSEDPLLFYRKISEFASKHLDEAGALYFELNEFYKVEIHQLMKNYFSDIEFKKDLQGKWRMVKAMHPLS